MYTYHIFTGCTAKRAEWIKKYRIKLQLKTVCVFHAATFLFFTPFLTQSYVSRV